MDNFTGKICTWFGSPKNYGFIKDDRTGRETFFHRNDVTFHPDELKAGLRITYQIVAYTGGDGKPKDKAFNICLPTLRPLECKEPEQPIVKSATALPTYQPDILKALSTDEPQSAFDFGGKK
ncbi:MAG: cold shock domain-containing protein [Acidobacteriia bacterium]|nr:cold shock domain-containing protein [Terriglobia bacterium]